VRPSFDGVHATSHAARTRSRGGVRALSPELEGVMAEQAEQVIRDFCAAFGRLDVDAVMSFFADDPTYHNMPGPPAQGTDAVRATVTQFLGGWDRTEWRILNMARAGNVVFAERLDITAAGDRSVELPCVGVFELSDGKIKTWRDYFDLATYTRAMLPGGASRP
jgi:limonene-1,2-epoxide hydrolase